MATTAQLLNYMDERPEVARRIATRFTRQQLVEFASLSKEDFKTLLQNSTRAANHNALLEIHWILNRCK